MRYEYLISHNLALLDLPVIKYDQVKTKQNNYIEKIFRQLLVCDQLPDNDQHGVLKETIGILETVDPAFEILSHNQFAKFISSERHKYVWDKTKKDYNAYIRAEIKRRNQENPYFNAVPARIESWDMLPDFSRQKRNQPWQFDNLFLDSQSLAGEIYELMNTPGSKDDKDFFRAKVSSVLVPEKIIYSLNGNEGGFGFAGNDITLVNIKLSLDGYKLSEVFLNRVIESLHKIKWNNSNRAELLDQTISFADRLGEKLRMRISEVERRFMLFVEAIEQQNREEDQD